MYVNMFSVYFLLNSLKILLEISLVLDRFQIDQNWHPIRNQKQKMKPWMAGTNFHLKYHKVKKTLSRYRDDMN